MLARWAAALLRAGARAAPASAAAGAAPPAAGHVPSALAALGVAGPARCVLLGPCGAAGRRRPLLLLLLLLGVWARGGARPALEVPRRQTLALGSGPGPVAVALASRRRLAAASGGARGRARPPLKPALLIRVLLVGRGGVVRAALRARLAGRRPLAALVAALRRCGTELAAAAAPAAAARPAAAPALPLAVGRVALPKVGSGAAGCGWAALCRSRKWRRVLGVEVHMVALLALLPALAGRRPAPAPSPAVLESTAAAATLPPPPPALAAPAAAPAVLRRRRRLLRPHRLPRFLCRQRPGGAPEPPGFSFQRKSLQKVGAS